MKKQPDATYKTKQAFIDVFCDLYTQKPVEKISVQELANGAGYNRSTFYEYFSDIYDLLACIENDALCYMKENMQDEKNKTRNSDTQKPAFLFGKKSRYLKALLGDYGSTRFLERLKNEMCFEIEKQGLFSDNPMAPYLIEYRAVTTVSLFRLWLKRKSDLSPEEMFGLINRLHKEGTAPFISG